jgi:hypothetical protein
LLSVPDFKVLAAMLLDTSFDQRKLQNIIYGGQTDGYDYHKSMFTEELLADDLREAGFCDPVRIPGGFGIFADTSNYVLNGRPISLNMVAHAC